MATRFSRARVLKWLKLALVIYVLIGVALYYLLDRFLFRPTVLPADHKFSFSQPFEEINLPVTPEKNINIIRFTVQDSVRKGAVLYLHGNRQNVERYAPFAKNFTDNGYEVWMPDYPGFGKSTGPISESIIKADAEMVYKMMRAQFGADSIVVYGKSMGSGPACYVALRQDCRSLVLETPYYSLDALFRRYAFMYPVSSMISYHFRNDECVKLVTEPVYILHGTDDGVIPFSHGKRLSKVRPGIELTPIDGGSHNDLNDFPAFRDRIGAILSPK